MLSFKAILGSLSVMLVAAITVLSVVSYQNNEDLLKTSLRVSQTNRALQKADQILSSFKDARLFVNHVIITGDTSNNVMYVTQMTGLPTQLNELRSLLAHHDRQTSNIDSLALGFRQFKIVSDSLIGLVKAGGPREVVVKAFLNSVSLRDHVTSQIGRIKDAQEILLQGYEAANAENQAKFTRTFIALLFGIAVLLVSTFLVARYNFNKRIRMQQDLTRANVLFEKVFYESPISVVISEFDTGKILNCNKVFAAIVNYEINELIGRTPVELGIFKTQEERREVVERAERKGMARHTEAYIKPRDKDPMYVSIDAHVIPLYDRKCLLTAIMDLTTHKKAEDDIKKALASEIELNKLKTNFVTLASHEFRTPLTTILSSTFLLENYLQGESHDKVGKHLARIKSSVNGLTSILDEFLSVTKIEEDHVQPNIERIDLPKCIAGICNNFQTLAKNGQVIHYTHLGEIHVNTDPVLLGNILSNLVSNAIKYSAENSPVYVTSSVDSKIYLTVKDEGIGISEADQKHLFQRFYRATNAGAVQGTGLGLHIMKRYVEMLEGYVELKSELGRGTQVEVTLIMPDLKPAPHPDGERNQ